VVVNLAVLAALLARQVGFVEAQTAAILTAMTSNYFLNNAFTTATGVCMDRGSWPDSFLSRCCAVWALSPPWASQLSSIKQARHGGLPASRAQQ